MTITTIRAAVLSLAFALLFAVSPSAASAAGENLIPNPGFESGSVGWTNDNEQGNLTAGATFTLSSTTASGTGSSAQASISTYISGTDAKWYFLPQIAATSTAQYYTFTDSYKSATTTSVFLYMSDGVNTTIQWLGDGSNSNTWQTFSAEFLVPAGVTFTIGHTLQSAGTLLTDDYSLVRSPAVPTFPHGLVTLSFDDGWDTYYQNAFPILNSSTTQMKNTLFVISQANVTDPVDYMTNAQILAVATSGVTEIGSHTRNHLDLAKDFAANPADMLASYGYASQAALLTGELNGAKSDLEALIGKTVSSFAYPYGSYDASVKAAVAAAGYTGARSVDQGYNLTSTDSFALKQQHIINTTTLAEAQGWIDTALASKSWLIFMFHDVRPNIETCVDREHKDVADQDCTDTALLQGIVNYLKTKETAQPGTVVTIAEGMALKTTNAIPVIAPHADVFAEAVASTSVVVTYTNPTVTPSGTVTCSPASGSYFNVGSTTVTCSATNAANTTFTVGVKLHAAPVATSVATTTLTTTPVAVTLSATGVGTLTFTTVIAPKFGTLAGTGANLVYTPQASTSAYVDTFTFKANDGVLDSNIATATITVTLPPDTVAPTIDNISAGTPSETGATITWTTSEGATSRVFYGTTENYTASTTLDTAFVMNHSVALSGLASDIFYHYVVVSTDNAGNTATSSDKTFVTARAQSSGGGSSGGGGGGGGGFIAPQTTGGVVLGASTQALTNAQIEAILNLLRSFNADQSVIDKVNASLRGKVVLGASTTSGKFVFTKTLRVGSVDQEVLELQKVLIKEGFLKVATPTTYFGNMTLAALKAYQTAHGIAPTGIVGPLTREALNKE